MSKKPSQIRKYAFLIFEKAMTKKTFGISEKIRKYAF